MFDRVAFKTYAKDVLRKNYWVAFGVVLVAGLISVAPALIASIWSTMSSFSAILSEDLAENVQDVVTTTYNATIVQAIITFITLVLLSGPIVIGVNSYFMKARENQGSLGDIFFAFKSGRYINSVKTYLLYGLCTSFVILLYNIFTAIIGLENGLNTGYDFILNIVHLALEIAVIIIGLGLFCVPFLLIDNPDMSPTRVLQLSWQMTLGYKRELFVVSLSFLGWILLGFVACCVGVLFVTPYIYATNAEIYAFLRYMALQNGITTAQELGISEDVYGAPQPMEPLVTTEPGEYTQESENPSDDI